MMVFIIHILERVNCVSILMQQNTLVSSQDSAILHNGRFNRNNDPENTIYARDLCLVAACNNSWMYSLYNALQGVPPPFPQCIGSKKYLACVWRPELLPSDYCLILFQGLWW